MKEKKHLINTPDAIKLINIIATGTDIELDNFKKKIISKNEKYISADLLLKYYLDFKLNNTVETKKLHAVCDIFENYSNINDQLYELALIYNKSSDLLKDLKFYLLIDNNNEKLLKLVKYYLLFKDYETNKKLNDIYIEKIVETIISNPNILYDKTFCLTLGVSIKRYNDAVLKIDDINKNLSHKLSLHKEKRSFKRYNQAKEDFENIIKFLKYEKNDSVENYNEYKFLELFPHNYIRKYVEDAIYLKERNIFIEKGNSIYKKTVAVLKSMNIPDSNLILDFLNKNLISSDFNVIEKIYFTKPNVYINNIYISKEILFATINYLEINEILLNTITFEYIAYNAAIGNIDISAYIKTENNQRVLIPIKNYK